METRISSGIHRVFTSRIREKEFVIAPVKWPYYFITTRFIVNQLIKRGYLARKVVEKEAKYLHKKEALKGQVKTKLGEIKSSRKIRE